MNCSLCNNSTLQYDEEKKEWKSLGDPTEVALLVAAKKANLDRVCFFYLVVPPNYLLLKSI